RADEVELVEFGTNPCKDVTQTIAGLLNIQCSGSGGPRGPRSFISSGVGSGLHAASGSYVILWEKR
ncbi:MAG TPA: hypothetical protein VFU23_03490, partial [Gemmatimonadales bacterium]|nr:hypothetical protein [Gemmatimonadales bacterium]